MISEQDNGIHVGDSIWGALEALHWIEGEQRLDVAPDLTRVHGVTSSYRQARTGRTITLVATSPYTVARAYVVTEDGQVRHLRTVDEVWEEVAGGELQYVTPQEFSPTFDPDDLAIYHRVRPFEAETQRFVWVRSRSWVRNLGWSYYCTNPNGSYAYQLGGRVLEKPKDSEAYRAAVAEQACVQAAKAGEDPHADCPGCRAEVSCADCYGSGDALGRDCPVCDGSGFGAACMAARTTAAAQARETLER